MMVEGSLFFSQKQWHHQSIDACKEENPHAEPNIGDCEFPDELVVDFIEKGTENTQVISLQNVNSAHNIAEG